MASHLGPSSRGSELDDEAIVRIVRTTYTTSSGPIGAVLALVVGAALFPNLEQIANTAIMAIGAIASAALSVAALAVRYIK